MPPETNEQNPNPSLSPIKPISSTPPDAPKEKPAPSIHTLEGDIFSAVKDENYSNNIVKIAAKARKIEPDSSSAFKSNNTSLYIKTVIILGVLIVLIVAGILMYYLFKPNSLTPPEGNPNTVATTTPDTTQLPANTYNILEAEALVRIDIKNLNKFQGVDKIQQVQKELRAKKINKNTAVQVDLGLTAAEFFQKNQYSGGEGLVRALGTDYMFGFFNTSTDVFESFVVFRIGNYDAAFAEMLSWEGYVAIDFKDMFKDSTQIFAIATSTDTETTPAPTTPIKAGFRDRVIKNTDARVYIDTDGTVKYVYGFINKDYLIITGGVDSFIDIKTRLLNRNILR